ncbi:MAG: 3,4-dihydroxy-2-butanone-4-phosphate synthase [Polyangiaceae bacterium]
MSPVLSIDPGLLERVNGAIADIRAGKMVILVDDEDRENEGDLTMAAEFVTPEAINFMATHGRGLICVTLTEDQIERLELPMMQAPGRRGPPLGTAFTVSVEARHGVTTGISAADRAHTTKVCADPNTKPEDLVSPGHVFPLRARNGGVLVRTGQTEGSVDLARLAGATPAGVICEIMREDGTMARMPDLEVFGKKHGLRILSIADMIQYRLQTEQLVLRVREGEIILDATGTPWRALVYNASVDQRQFLALVKGDIEGPEPVLCRMHQGSLLADVFATREQDGGKRLRKALSCIEEAGRGVVVYLPSLDTPFSELAASTPPGGTAEAPPSFSPPAASASPLREFGLGAQVLRDLGVERIKLLTANPRKIAGLRGFGLTVTENIPLDPPGNC